ncbi:RES domain-containing protein [Mycobacteroides abscessus]|uniref:RES family NAD+ phosphorylase n=1 Tax=Mycobacteroides abscessus TaxID=36809 RepID=UPI000C25D00A|nr:RES family NAD+ phosphorylase [Mycobacteroides abscessus]RIR81952.1 RES domain-containing protein [Mycobacteroides abscessus]
MASHLDGPALISPPPGCVYRVARSSDPLYPSRIAPEDALQSKGNRFDVLGGGIIYFGTTVRGCFAETVSRYRPTATMRKLVNSAGDQGFVVCGGVPKDWRDQRTIVEARLIDPLPFIDIDHPQTHEYLTEAIADELSGLGVSTLDVGNIRGHNRLITRAASSWAYWANDANGMKYSGIRYMSRVIPDEECWAVFEGTDINEESRRSIAINDPDLAELADMWGLRIF